MSALTTQEKLGFFLYERIENTENSDFVHEHTENTGNLGMFLHECTEMLESFQHERIEGAAKRSDLCTRVLEKHCKIGILPHGRTSCQ